MKPSFHKKLFQKEKNKLLLWIYACRLSGHLWFSGQRKSPLAGPCYEDLLLCIFWLLHCYHFSLAQSRYAFFAVLLRAICPISTTIFSNQNWCICISWARWRRTRLHVPQMEKSVAVRIKYVKDRKNALLFLLCTDTHGLLFYHWQLSVRFSSIITFTFALFYMIFKYI